MKKMHVLVLFVIMGSLAGCVVPQPRGDQGINISAGLDEPAWVRNAEPLSFEEEDWFPTDEVESLLENEIFQVGVCRGLPVYIEKTDVRPFERLYTRFAKNRYRAFQR